ncbi:hypothetical protein V5799_033360 [Amblyomma americanum]|uniref:RING-type domain-containing protein n=1 Tax=Amblyomma americanum TaxID=6943 RepID=A0AAQ4DNJ2_AMBAM
MLDAGTARLLRLSGGDLSGVKWRPTRFAAGNLHRYACSLCGVIPNSAQLLPCGHMLCGTCKDSSCQDGEVGVCPFDEEHFGNDDCNAIRLPTRKIESLKAYCWNESGGCQFSGALPDVLRHYEEECSYHRVECPRCGDTVPHAGLATHYRSVKCRIVPSTSPDNHESLPNGAAFEARDVYGSPEAFKTLLGESLQEQQLALQSKLNKLSEQVQEVGEMFRRMSGEEDRDSGGNRMPWHLEQRHILRRLNILASESLARMRRADVPAAIRETIPAISCFGIMREQWKGLKASSSNLVEELRKSIKNHS